MQIKKIDLNAIVPYANNVKEHPQEQIEQIKKSILEFGNNDPIAIDEFNMIIEGHGRYIALQELGFKEADCIVIENLTEEQKNAYRIVHNQLTMNTGFDMERLKTELAKIENIDLSQLGLEEMLEKLEEKKPVEDDNFDLDEAFENIEEPVTRYGDFYKLGNHFLLCGDSTKAEDVNKLMQNQKADLFITDPPYNVDYEGEAGKIENDNMEDADFKNFLCKAFANANNVMKEGASFYIWHSDSEGYNFRSACHEIGWNIRQCLIWNKNALVMGRQDYQWKHEPCLYGWKDGASHHWYSGRSETTVLNYDKPKHNDLHPTMKPLDLFGYLMQNSTKKKDIVLDLFAGSGTSLIVSEQLERTCYTMELDPKFCDVIINRWETLTGGKAELINE